MRKGSEIVAVAKVALAESGGEVSAAVLVAEVERRIGRQLREYERGLYLHQARREFMRETSHEIMSKAGTLSVASPEQSANRRRSKHERAITTLRTNTEELGILLSRSDLTEDVRRSLERVRDKTADTVLALQSAEQRRRRTIVSVQGLGRG